jgi:Tfp pilus assembly protein PilF
MVGIAGTPSTGANRVYNQRSETMPRLAILFLLLLAAAVACSRAPAISDETARQAVTAFYVSLAALQTSQDVLARSELEKLIAAVPDEPAGWANLGLLLLRQQQTDEAETRLAKAMALAPRNAPIARLNALAASRTGAVPEAIAAWRRAIALDGGDLKAPFALAQELERAGGDASEREALTLLQQLSARSHNIAATVELARLAAKRGDAAALRAALDTLARSVASWPAEAQERWAAVQSAAARGPADAATPVLFLKNVLIRDAVYRSAMAALTTPRSEVGEPLVALVKLPTPPPRPAPADDQLRVAVDPQPAAPLQGAATAAAAWLSGDDRPIVVALAPAEARFSSGTSLKLAPPEPGGLGPHAIAGADLDYDFRIDFVIAGGGGLRIFRQDEKRGFADGTNAARLPADVTKGAFAGVWPADVDTDGDLDLVAARREGPALVLRNNGDRTFAVQTPFAAVAQVRDFVWADVDGEGTPDAVLLDAQGAVRIMRNLRGGAFREVPMPADAPRLAAIAAADATGDGLMDVIGAAADGRLIRISAVQGGAAFEAAELTRLAASEPLSPGSARLILADLDNNGAEDVVLAGGSGSRVAIRADDGSFRDAGTVPFAIAAAADLDGDGRLDLIGADGSGGRVARTAGAKRYHWQTLRPRAAAATGDQRINTFGVGGEIETRTGLHAQKRAIAAPVVHFGLGDATRAEVARITWPNGILQSEFDLAADAAIAATQRLKGSCPWLFTWDGREMRFVTDFIWRSPLGLRINAQAAADVQMTEDWVRIRGDQLAPRDGAYDLRITAELWETHFFDHVSLLAVDHPAEVEVFVDERFSVPPPAPAVIVTAPVQPFAAVRDDGGRDVSGVAQSRDDRHLDFAGRGAYQGVTRSHYVELELPETAPRSGPLWLVAQGWVHPTDSSINVALGQSAHAPPQGLSLHVSAGDAPFTVARTGLGFPAGKDKTVLIDLRGVFGNAAAGRRRLRLNTNLEIFWDRLGWAVGRPDVRIATQRIGLRSASLGYRGYSVTEQKDASTPERPRYVLAGTAPRWRDLEGYHTRFGDVRELLLGVDDRYVIMNACDEMRLQFAAPPAPAAGWSRDFVLIGDGWVKDGDYNTTASRTMLPLPAHRTPRYVQGSGRLEDDPVYRQHQADFERYHTRYISPDAARDALRVTIPGAARD